MRIGPLTPTEREFDDALATARTGAIQTEWFFPDVVLTALYQVASEPSPSNVDAAREAWDRTSPLVTALRGVRAVVFDVGETLVDETRAWTEAALAAGVTPLTLMGVLGSAIERGADHREVWWTLDVEPPPAPVIERSDLYPDAIACLRAVRRAGLRLGIAGNQPEGAEEQLRAVGAEVDFVASSSRWGVEKPEPEFFQRVLAEAGTPPEQTLYVGDRLDNDVLPAGRAGMRTVLIRRGPWGHLHALRPEADEADALIDSLTEIAEAVHSVL